MRPITGRLRSLGVQQLAEGGELSPSGAKHMSLTGSEMLSDWEPVPSDAVWHLSDLPSDQVKCQQQCLCVCRLPPQIRHGVDGGGRGGEC